MSRSMDSRRPHRTRLGGWLACLAIAAALLLPSMAQARPRVVFVPRAVRPAVVTHRPVPRALHRVWVAAHWTLSPRGWVVWVPGYWRCVR